MDHREPFELQAKGIASLLGEGALRVPPNQREFSWDEDKVTQFLTDITNAKQTDTPYFLGTVVLTPGAGNWQEVADGQQRLATTTMILAEIRNRFHQINDTIRVDGIQAQYLFTINLQDRELQPRLKLNVDDNEFFKKRILDTPDTKSNIHPALQSNRLIENAAVIIKQHFDHLEKTIGLDNFPSMLLSWITYLADKADVACVKVTNAANAYVMFETLNDRGMRTSQADLVKNFLFDKAGSSSLIEAQRHWSMMRGAIETVGEDDLIVEFLRIAFCVLDGRTTEREVMQRVKSRANGESNAIELLSILSELAIDFAAILILAIK